jgi:hypothetical protein
MVPYKISNTSKQAKNSPGNSPKVKRAKLEGPRDALYIDDYFSLQTTAEVEAKRKIKLTLM